MVLVDSEGTAVQAIINNDFGTIIYDYGNDIYRGARADGELLTLNCRTLSEVKRSLAAVVAHEHNGSKG